MRLFIKDIKVDIIQPDDEVKLKKGVKKFFYGDFDLKSKGHFYLEDLKQNELRKILIILLDNDSDVKSIVLRLRKNLEPIEVITKEKFKLIEAGGGIVEKNETALYIHRLGKWDLPKGKIEKGETIEQGALREVYEECNVEAKITKHLMNTFHIHKYKEKYRLKKTYWYLMEVVGNPVLEPQLEEFIDEVCWKSKKEAKNIVYPDTYKSLRKLLNLYFE